MTRLQVNESSSCFKLYKEQTESILFQDLYPCIPLEYSPNKFFVRSFSYNSHMYLVHDWKNVILITDPNPLNTEKNFAFPIPEFDEESNPFIAVCGNACLSLLNVKNHMFQPLINQSLIDHFPAFIKREDYGLSVHFSTRVQETDGTGKELLQYSYAELKDDAL